MSTRAPIEEDDDDDHDVVIGTGDDAEDDVDDESGAAYDMVPICSPAGSRTPSSLGGSRVPSLICSSDGSDRGLC